MAEIDYYRHLLTIMLRTRGARFTAASDLAFRERVSLVTISVLSVYLIAWSVVSVIYADAITPEHSRFYMAVSITASVALLVISLLDFGLGRGVRADRLQANALEITATMRELERVLEQSPLNFVRARQLAAEYEASIGRVQINHSPADDRRWRYQSSRSDKVVVAGFLALRATLYDWWFHASRMAFHWSLIVIVIGGTAWYTIFVLFQ